MENLLQNLKSLLPDVTFEAGDNFFWSPEHSRITYKRDLSANDQYTWSLLHEASHALLGHQVYKTDFELLLLEVAAWRKAKKLAEQFTINIDEDHIQDCLDTYRDWLHQRATCPRCSTVSLQAAVKEYQCHNCGAFWRVSTSRFCRPYRRTAVSSKPPRLK